MTELQHPGTDGAFGGPWPAASVSSVWLTGQRPSRLQRRGRYVPEAMRHPAKMLPAIAAQAITTFTWPDDVVIDPMCGIGTTLIEAVHLGRNAVGVEYEPAWAQLAAKNIAKARQQGARGSGDVYAADARAIADLLPHLTGQAALVLTSPPYGSRTHGHVTPNPGDRVHKFNHRYSHDPANLAHRRLPDLLDGFTQILDGCYRLLRPGGILAITARPYRHNDSLIDLPGAVHDCAHRAGFEPLYRIAALLCGLRDGTLITRASFFQMLETRRHRAAGVPAHVLAHEDLLIFRKPGNLRVSSTVHFHSLETSACA